MASAAIGGIGHPVTVGVTGDFATPRSDRLGGRRCADVHTEASGAFCGQFLMEVLRAHGRHGRRPTGQVTVLPFGGRRSGRDLVEAQV